MLKKYLFLCAALFVSALMNLSFAEVVAKKEDDSQKFDKLNSFQLGSERLAEYQYHLMSKRVALVVNHTSVNQQGEHLIDFLRNRKVTVVKLFSPEHGIRGTANAGDDVSDNKDSATQLPIISLYGTDALGDKKLMRARDIEDVDVIIFDLQDVGVRFYTYISTLHYVLEVAAQQNKKVLILDRPNPNGDYIAGPVLNQKFQSFVGMHPIPLVHGLTVGELAKMIVGEGWIKSTKKFADENLIVIPMNQYSHSMPYVLPKAPSPNLLTAAAVRWYPSLGLFESTTISVGRGSETPFTLIGHPDKRLKINHDFKVADIPAAWPQRNQHCYGEKLSETDLIQKQFDLTYFYRWYHSMRSLGYAPEEIIDRPEWLAKLLGTDTLPHQLEQELSVDEILASWEEGLERYSAMRQKYLLYP